MHVALLFVKYFGVMSATLQSWGCAGEFSNSWSQSCSMICLTTEMSDFLLPAVFGDQTLLREAEVALGPSLMLLISLPAEEKNQNLIKTCWGALVSSASLSSLVPWDENNIISVVTRFEGAFDCKSAAQAPYADKAMASKKKNFLPPSSLKIT